KFLTVFPENPATRPQRSFAQLEFTPAALTTERVTYLSALGKLMHATVPETTAADFIAYFDTIISQLVRRSSNILLKIAAVRLLATCVPVTNANRLRIDKKFLPAMKILSEFCVDLIIPGSADGIRSNRSSNAKITAEPIKNADMEIVDAVGSSGDSQVAAASSIPASANSASYKISGQASEVLQGILEQEISRFWNVWYPKPQDSELQLLRSNSDAISHLPVHFQDNGKCLAPEIEFFKGSINAVAKRSIALKSIPQNLVNTPITSAKSRAVTEYIPPSLFHEDLSKEFLDCSQLSFNLNPPTIVFNRYPFYKELYIQNKSTTRDLAFFLQASPAEFFSAMPSHGRIDKGESIKIKISFTPQSHKPRKNIEILGFIQLRSSQGLTFERIGLKAYNTPVLKILPNAVDFGFCPKNETRTATIIIQNLLPIECPCILLVSQLQMVSDQDSAFVVPFQWSQPLLMPKETRHVKIQFCPLIDGEFQEKLNIFAMGGNLITINLNGFGGASLKVSETKIDFGPTDIFYNSVSRRLFLENKDPHHELPVRFQSSTNEIDFNSSKELILRPGESRHVGVSFLSRLTGLRQENIRIFAPNSIVAILPVVATSGPLVTIPTTEEIIFPVTLIDHASTVFFPIRNLTQSHAHLQLLLPLNSPFSLRMMEADPTIKQTFDLKQFESPDAFGFNVTISAHTNAVLEIVFLSSTWGTFRAQLTTTTIKPKKILVATNFLSAVAINDVYMMREKPLLSIRKFLSSPSKETPTGLLVKKTLDVRQVEMRTKTSEVFELDPPTQTIFGFSLKSKSEDVWEYVTLTNLSGNVQNYQLVISESFYTNVPIDGELEAFTSLDIPLRFNPNILAIECNRENEEKLVVGQIAVFDDDNGVVSSGIFGTVGDLVTVEIRKGTDVLQFPSARVMEKLTRKIIVRNKTPLDIIWEGKAVGVANKQKSHDYDGVSVSEWCPFGLTVARINLKPFDYATIDIHFQATSSGQYSGRLVHTYIDPIYHIIGNEYHRTRSKRDLTSVEFQCEVGAADVELDQELVNFGDILNSEITERSLALTNRQMIDSKTLMTLTFPFTMEKFNPIISNQQSCSLNIIFRSVKPKFYNSFLWVCTDSGTKMIPIFANAGYAMLKTNLGQILRGEIDERQDMQDIDESHLIDFGFVEKSSSKTKILRLTNTGTFELFIKNISTKDSIHVVWKLLEDFEASRASTIPFFESSPEYWDLKEIDWDDFDFTIHEEKENCTKVAQVQQVEPKKPIKKRKGTKAIIPSAIVNQPATAYKQFPVKLSPFQSLYLALSFGGSEMGSFIDVIDIDADRNFGEPELFRLCVQGNIQPPLTILNKKVEFGSKAVHSKHVDEIKIRNEGLCPLRWTLKSKSIFYSPMLKYNPAPLPRELDSILSPVRFFPSDGVLAPGAVQAIEIVFCPNLPQYEISNILQLKTEEFHQQDILIHGIGASGRIVLNESKIDFGVLRVGTTKSFTLKLHNQGILHTKYFIECGDYTILADPEEGILEGNGKIDLSVTFKPKTAGKTRTFLKITPHSDERYDLSSIFVHISGTASYPDISVLTKLIDFGTALFGAENSKAVVIENKGAADAEIVFSCAHPSIKLEGGGAVILPANSKKDIKLIYIPEFIEKLNIKAFLRSSDTRGDHFMIHLRGSVGVPKILFQPTTAMKEIDFGVCAIKGVQKRFFHMKNEGNINLTVYIKVEVVSIILNENGTKKYITVSKTPFTVTPQTVALPIGEEIGVSVNFSPEKLATYEYKMVIKYDFRSISTSLKGTGGRAIFQITSPLRRLDFGVCRLNRVFRKVISVKNTGNLGVDFHIRPEGVLPDWINFEGTNIIQISEDSNDWTRDMNQLGLKILNPDGFCPASDKSDIIIEYFPQTEAAVNIRFRIYFDGNHEDIDIYACAAIPKLTLMSSTNENLVLDPSKTSLFDIGVHTINSEYIHSLKLVNDGDFAVDYLIQPIGIREFDVFPMRGYIEPASSILLKVVFNPTSESKFQMCLKVLWEGTPLKLNIIGSGGIGKLEVVYLDERDTQIRCLDFNMVPFHSYAEKRFYLCNIGLVPIDADVHSKNPDFTLTQVGEPFSNQRGISRINHKKAIMNWFSNISVSLPPSTALEISVKFFSKSPTTVINQAFIKSKFCEMLVPMRGKGGTFALSHKGDISFGDIASNYTFSRKITLINSGSIPANLTLEWLIVGRSAESASAYVKLVENYSNTDPRSGFIRISYFQENKINDPNYTLTAKDYWKMLSKIVHKPEAMEYTLASHNNISLVERATPNDSISEILSKEPANIPGQRRGRLRGSIYESSTAFNRGSSRLTGGFATKKAANNHLTNLTKRRQTFFHLVSTTQVSSQSAVLTPAFLKVSPETCLIPSYGEVHLTVELNLPTEDTFLATLVIKSDVANTPPHEIPLTATPKIVSIICDDTRIDINFRIINPNSALSVLPGRGTLKIGQTVAIQFIFRPTDEGMQTGDIIFEPDCSQHIRLKMSGGGGFAKASLSKYRRFDFGHCMIGKDTESLLPITNEGNAILHLTRFTLHETDTFFKGADWPTGRISLFPGQSYNLALVFNPHEESPLPGRLVIGTISEFWEIELIGLGREAVLIISKLSLDFADCLIGNSYERKLGLKNVGDVNYPVTFSMDKEFPDLQFIPPSLVINPFSENYVLVSYTPTSSVKTTTAMTVSSPYSRHNIPISLHSGTATLEFTAKELDFGMFERVERPSVKLGIKNVGTVKTSFTVRDSIKPSMFQLSNAKGLLLPGRQAEITVTHIKHTVCQFDEKLMVKSDLVENFHFIRVIGQCEESLLKPDEFSLLNLGICPVLDPTTKILEFKNYGRFPLSFEVKSTYPLKVLPLVGYVLGGESAKISISWSPSGAYELRTQLTLVTNIGHYNVIVRGKATFPELFLKNVYLDFGVCGVGYPYTEKLTMFNKGKVPLRFNIPPMREASYSVSQSTGFLNVKESIDIDVGFKPSGVGRFAYSFIVECKGISYKEVVVVGIGGNAKLDITPSNIELGRSPCDLRVYHVITLANAGEVVLYVDWDHIPDAQESNCSIHLPESLVIMPGKLVIKTKERSYVVPVTGIGVRILLTEKSRRILESENLPILTRKDPFEKEISIESVEYWFKLKSMKRLATDLQIVESIADRMKEAKIRETSPSIVEIEELDDHEVPTIEIQKNSNAVLLETAALLETIDDSEYFQKDKIDRIAEKTPLPPITTSKNENLTGNIKDKLEIQLFSAAGEVEPEKSSFSIIAELSFNMDNSETVEEVLSDEELIPGQTTESSPITLADSHISTPEASKKTIFSNVPSVVKEQTLIKDKAVLFTELQKTRKNGARLDSKQVGEISRKFIHLKQEGFDENKKLAEDEIIEEVIQFSTLVIMDIATEYLTDPVEFFSEINLTTVLARPAPIPTESGNEKGKHNLLNRDSGKKYKEFPNVVRNMRNAKTKISRNLYLGQETLKTMRLGLMILFLGRALALMAAIWIVMLTSWFAVKSYSELASKRKTNPTHKTLTGGTHPFGNYTSFLSKILDTEVNPDLEPPPRFKEWMQLAENQNCLLGLENYAQIYRDLAPYLKDNTPFKALQGNVEGATMGVHQNQGKFTEGRSHIFEALASLFAPLPDFRYAISLKYDEPQIIPSETSSAPYKSPEDVFENSQCLRSRHGTPTSENRISETTDKLAHGFFMGPDTFLSKNTKTPLFSQAKTDCYWDLMIPMKYHDEILTKGIKKDTILWENKKDVLFWRGSSTGGKLLQWAKLFEERYPRNAFDAGKSDPPILSQRKNDTSLSWLAVDIGLYTVTQASTDVSSQIQKEYPFHDFVTFDQTLNYKYLLVIDGNTWPSRTPLYLSSNSVILLSTVFTDWFMWMLEPYVHYVPVKMDLSDLEDQLRWLRKNDGKAQQISLNARRLMERINRFEQMQCYTGLMMLEFYRIYQNHQNGTLRTI
ncbi:F-actin-capping protein subunit beta, partial [Physocladia obscura]